MPIMTVGTGRALIYSGIVAWDPSQPTTDGGVLPDHWYRSDGPLWQDAGVTPAVLDGAVVGRWEDLTANADHVNQAVAGNKPTLQNGAGDLLNGHPVIRFDGVDDYLQGAFTTGGAMNQPNTIFVVSALDAAAVNDGNWRNVVDGLINRYAIGQNPLPAPDAWFLYAGLVLDDAASDSNWNLWSGLLDGATSRLRRNGISIANGNAGALNLDGLTIGNDTTVTAPWDGDITELIYYGADLSDADENQVGQYLAARYGLTYTDI